MHVSFGGIPANSRDGLRTSHQNKWAPSAN